MRYMIHDPALGFVVKDTGKGEQCEYKGGKNACTALKDGIGKSEYETTRREVLVHVSAVELRERVRILRDALTATTQAFTGEEVERAQMQALAALEATKEGA